MANTFKLKTKGGGAVAANTAMTVYTTPASTTTIVVGMTLSNLTANQIAATVSIENNDGDNVTFLKDIPIPTGSAVEVMSGNKVVLEATDTFTAESDVNNSLDVALTIMEIT